MPTYLFARNTERTYWDVPAANEAEARAKLATSLEGEDEFRSGHRATEDDESPMEMIDVEADTCTHCGDERPAGPETGALWKCGNCNGLNE